MFSSSRAGLPAWRCFVSWLLGLLLPLFIASAQPPRSFTETAHVELVLVDVLVTDRGGRPVLDLAREDFTLWVDGEPQEISQFSAPLATYQTKQDDSAAGRETDRPAQSAGLRGDSDHLIVIYLDDRNLLPTGRFRILTQLTAVLEEQSNSRSRVMIAAYDGSVEILLLPTRSRKRVSTVLAQKTAYGSQSLLSDREDERILSALKPALEAHVSDLIRAGLPVEQILDAACSSTQNYVRTHTQQVYGRVESSALAFQEFARSLSAFPGRKTLLHVSDGLPLIAGQEAVQYLVSLCDGSFLNQGLETGSVLTCCPPARYFPSAALLELQDFNTAKLWDRVAAEANRNRVTVYTIQASGLETRRAGTVSDVRMAGSTEFAATVNKQDPLFLMADETGGRAFINTNDFQPDLNKMIANQGARYELAFQPDRAADGKVHRIRLKIDRRGARPFYRKSYFAETASDRTVTQVLATLYHGQEDNRLGVDVEAAARDETSGNKREVDVEIRVPLENLVLLPDGDRLKGLLTVMLAARDGRGTTLPVASKRIPLFIALGDENEIFQYVVRIPLGRGREWQFAVAIRDDLANTASFVTAKLEVP